VLAGVAGVGRGTGFPRGERRRRGGARRTLPRRHLPPAFPPRGVRTSLQCRRRQRQVETSVSSSSSVDRQKDTGTPLLTRSAGTLAPTKVSNADCDEILPR
jgi:hypothetical protein